MLSADYAAEHLRWRRTQPLWVLVLRVFRVPQAPVITLRTEDARCSSWFELPESITSPDAPTAVLDDRSFAVMRASVAAAIADGSTNAVFDEEQSAARLEFAP